MEKAVQFRGLKALRGFDGKCDRIYFGVDFCERLLPTERELESAVSFTARGGKDFTFVTPYLTEGGVSRVERLLGSLPGGSEVVFNDWGALDLIKSSGMTPVLGRLLVKYKRDPRVPAVSSKIPAGGRRVLSSSVLTQKRFGDFLKESGVNRVELDNPPFAVDHGSLKGFKVSAHTPYVYVTTGRQCLTRYFVSGRFGIRECKRECARNSFTWAHNGMGRPLMQRGNSIFYENREKPEFGFDRMVEDVSLY